MNYRDLVHQIISTTLIHRHRITKSAQQAGLYYGQPMILEYIMNNNLCTQKDLAKSLHISPASVATSIKRLEKSGLISRITDENDSRKNRLSVTESGLAAIKNFREICDSTDREMFKNFTEEECEILNNLMKRLYNNLDNGDFCNEKIKHKKEEEKAL